MKHLFTSFSGRAVRTLTACLCFAATIPMASSATGTIIYFDKDNDRPDRHERRRLEQWMSDNADLKHRPVVLRGHADRDASNDYNQGLAARRNAAVQALLEENGFTVRRAETYGEEWPACAGSDQECLRLNRRVEVVVPVSGEECWYLDAQLGAPQVFFFSNTDTMTLQASMGTRLAAHPGTFVNRQGEVVDDVRLELHEFYSTDACVLKKLTTQTYDDRLLESGGMVFIKAFSGEDTLKIRPGAAVDVQMVTQRDSLWKGMELFYGMVEQGFMRWFAPYEADQKDGPDPRVAPPFPVVDLAALINQTSEGDTVLFGDRAMVVRSRNKRTEEEARMSVEGGQLWWWTNAPLTAEAEREALLDNALSIRMLGMINCDRYREFPERKTLVVRGVEDPNAVHMVIVDQENTCFRMNLDPSGRYMFTVPKNYSGTVISYHPTASGYKLGISRFQKSEELIHQHMAECTKEEMSERIAACGTEFWASKPCLRGGEVMMREP